MTAVDSTRVAARMRMPYRVAVPTVMVCQTILPVAAARKA